MNINLSDQLLNILNLLVEKNINFLYLQSLILKLVSLS